MIELDGKKYEYSFTDKTAGELVIYEEHTNTPLVSCNLSSDHDEVAAVATVIPLGS